MSSSVKSVVPRTMASLLERTERHISSLITAANDIAAFVLGANVEHTHLNLNVSPSSAALPGLISKMPLNGYGWPPYANSVWVKMQNTTIEFDS